MPRPEIQGLQYFPYDVGFYRDRKIRLLRGECGSEGIECYQRLLCRIYEDKGYYTLWDNSEDYALLADDMGCSEEKIRLIVSACLRRSLFSDTLFKVGNVLTSRGIQRRYFNAIRETKVKAAAHGRHTYISGELCLLTAEDLAEINKTSAWLKVAQKKDNSTNNADKSTNNPGKSTNNPPKKRKENERKEDKRREDDEGASAAKVAKHFINNIHPSAAKTVVDEVCSWLDTFPAEVIIRAIDEAIRHNKRSLAYINGILRNWQDKGLLTVSVVEAYLDDWQKEKKGKGANHIGDTGGHSQPGARGDQYKNIASFQI